MKINLVDASWFINNQELRNINKWLNRILNLEFFNIIMKKYKPWDSSQPTEFFFPKSTK